MELTNFLNIFIFSAEKISCSAELSTKFFYNLGAWTGVVSPFALYIVIVLNGFKLKICYSVDVILRNSGYETQNILVAYRYSTSNVSLPASE